MSRHKQQSRTAISRETDCCSAVGSADYRHQLVREAEFVSDQQTVSQILDDYKTQKAICRSFTESTTLGGFSTEYHHNADPPAQLLSRPHSRAAVRKTHHRRTGRRRRPHSEADVRRCGDSPPSPPPGHISPQPSAAVGGHEVTVQSLGLTVTLAGGVVTTAGCNVWGGSGVGSEASWTGPRALHLPKVRKVWGRGGSWFAQTDEGLYAWGDNTSGQLGVGVASTVVRQPLLVKIKRSAHEVIPHLHGTFIRTSKGWLVSSASAPVAVPTAMRVTRWYRGGDTSFAWSQSGLHAMGGNWAGQCGTGGGRVISTLTPVDLPTDAQDRVDRVASNGESTFIFIGRRCFACGDNTSGQLGLGLDTESVAVPTELPFEVKTVSLGKNLSLFLTAEGPRLAGDNSVLQLSPLEAGAAVRDTLRGRNWHKVDECLRTAALIDLPWHVNAVTAIDGAAFVRKDHGIWYARGDNTGGRLGVGAAMPAVTSWMSVKADAVHRIRAVHGATVFITRDSALVAGTGPLTGGMPRNRPVKLEG